nr:hypothetical protein [uncultured Anaerotignum sp.]
MILLVASMAGIYFSIEFMLLYKSIPGLAVLFWLCINTYFLAMAIFFLLGRINYRSSERFRAEIPITFFVGKRKGSLFEIGKIYRTFLSLMKHYWG